MATEQHYDAIVVGSGVGGLTAALTAARRGQRVLVLEAAQQFGGYINPFSRKRFIFDTGLHYVGEAFEGGGMTKVLDDLQLHVPFQELNPEGFDWYVFPEYSVKLGRGIDRFRDQLRGDFPSEERGIDRFFKMLTGVDRAFDEVDAGKGIRGAFATIGHAWRLLRWRKITLAQMLDRYFRDPLLKAALSGPCGDLGLPPSRLSALYHMAVMTHYLGGGFYPVGGSGALRDALVNGLIDEGAELKRNAKVKRITKQARRVTGVETEDGAHYAAPCVISNADAVQTFRLAGLDEKRKWKKKIERMEPSISSVVVYLGVKGDLAGNSVGDGNVWHFGTSDIDAIYRRLESGALPNSDSMFITVPTQKDPSGKKAPAGHHTVEIVALSSAKPFRDFFDGRSMKRCAAYRALKEEIAGPLIETAERYIPDLRQNIVLKEISTPATNKHFTTQQDGSIYGPAHTPKQVLFGRFSPKAPLRGLFLCGASVIAGGVYPSMKSGAQAGQLANEAFGVREKASQTVTEALPAAAKG